jgi:hypothetical protein
VWLLPCRLLRRKNIAEALLITRWLRPEAWLVTTGGVSSAEEQPYANALGTAARKHGWRLRLGIMQGDETLKPSIPELLVASEAILLTSLQEGFGLPYLEAAALRRPLVARELPNISPDLKKFGFIFPQSYNEILVDPYLFNWRNELARQIVSHANWKKMMPRSVAKLVGQSAVLAAGKTPCPVAFSRLTLTAQLEVLARPIEESWERCRILNPFLAAWRERAQSGQLKTSPWPRSASRWLGGRAYVDRFLEFVPSKSSQAPPAGAGLAAQSEFLEKKLHVENLYPILWSIHS